MQALIITAYKDLDLLEENLKLFSGYFNCYVHIDKKAITDNSELLSRLNNIENVWAVSLYKINWGSYLHLMAIYKLLKKSLEDSDNTYFHIISGNDFPVKTPHEFEAFFTGNRKNYFEVTDIRNMPVMQKRYQIYHFQHVFNRKSSNRAEVYIDKIIRHLQYMLHIRRKESYAYKGLVWGSITRDGAQCCVDYIEKPGRIHSLKYCENSEEFLLTNAILGNDKLRETVDYYNLRYSIWSHADSPDVLDMSNLDDIMSSDAFFARKINNKGTKSQKQLYDVLKAKYE
jgi:hypothetical protein